MFLHLLTTWDFENQLCCADLERPGHNNNGLPIICLLLRQQQLHPRSVTYPLKNDGWNTSFLLGWYICRGYLNLPGSTASVVYRTPGHGLQDFPGSWPGTFQSLKRIPMVKAHWENEMQQIAGDLVNLWPSFHCTWCLFFALDNLVGNIGPIDSKQLTSAATQWQWLPAWVFWPIVAAMVQEPCQCPPVQHAAMPSVGTT